MARVWNNHLDPDDPDDSGYIFLPTISGSARTPEGRRKSYREGRAYEWPRERDAIQQKLRAHHQIDEQYWTPALFNAKQRREQYVRTEGAQWADLDANFNKARLKEYPPTQLWETSPGRLQGIWLMDEPKEGASWYSKENHRLSLHLGADPSGWDSTQLLRVPGSTHHKDDPVQGRVLIRKGPVHTWGDFTHLPEIPPAPGLGDWADDEAIADVDVEGVLGRIKLPGDAMGKLRGPSTSGDVSNVMWYLEMCLAEAGCTEAQIVAVMWNTAWTEAHYGGRGDKLYRLKVEAQKVTGKAKAAASESDGHAPHSPGTPGAPGYQGGMGASGAAPLIDGDKLLTRVREWLSTYVSTVVDSDLGLLTLWTVHTHLVMETYTTPRLQIDSPVHESGKTTVIEHLHRLCKQSIQLATISSPAMLTRMLDVGIRTILIDEADRALDPKKEGIADTLAVLNSGYKRGGTRPVLVPVKGGGWDVKEMPTFAPVALAGNNPTLPDDTRSRVIRVLLMPDRSGLIEESNWEEIEEAARALHDEIAAWADQVREQVKQARPDLPEGITGRFREKWSPLKRVADAAGGEWPDLADAMAVNDKKEFEMDSEDGMLRESPHVALLRHIYEVWPADTPFVSTERLIRRLTNAYPETWGPTSSYGKALTAKRLGSMLAKAYKIHSDREHRTGPRGYFYAHFARPWHRMGITPP